MNVDSGNESSPALDSRGQPVGQASSDKGLLPTKAAAPFSLAARYKVGWYIDGFNLYHAIHALGDQTLKWLNVKALAESYLREDQDLARVVFSTAYNTWDAGKRGRHIQYVGALQAEGVDVLLAKFDKVSKFCKVNDRYCKFYEEKQSDVNLAVEALSDVYDGLVDTVYFVTADSDQIPTFIKMRNKCPSVKVRLVAPPGRLERARELGNHADNVFELTARRISQHPLGEEYKSSNGKLIARRPDEYR